MGNSKKLTQQQENFIQEYIKTGIAYKAFISAYPKSKNWTRNAVDAKASNLLKNDKIQTRIAEYNKAVESTLAESTKLNQHKLLQAALEILEDTRHTPSQYANAINVLKLLYSQQGMMPKANNNTTVNIINNNSIDNISNFLDL